MLYPSPFRILMLFITLNFMLTPAHAQVLKQASTSPYSCFLNERNAKVNFEKANLGVDYSLADVLEHAYAHYPYLEEDGSSLVLVHEKESLTGKHFTFEQQWQTSADPYLVYGTQLKIHVDFEGKVWSLIHNCFDLSVLDERMLAGGSRDTYFKSRLADQLRAGDVADVAPVVYFEAEDKAVLGIQVTDLRADYSYVFNPDGEILFEKDRRTYAHAHAHTHTHGHDHKHAHHSRETASTEVVNVRVFYPDPITSAGVTYGQTIGYTDNNDTASPALNAELFDMQVEVTFEDGEYKLESDRVRILNEESPTPTHPPYTSTDLFYDRSDEEFEEVNAYFHLMNYRQQLDDLGYSDLMDEQIWVDPRGGTDDNSFHRFDSAAGKHRLKFGIGGVDDAEDADVVIHEYGHALSYDACPNCNNGGTQRLALDEGLGDYFACSYSRRINEYYWDKMFGWDGHGVWPGRNIINNKSFPNDVEEGDIYDTSEIISAAMMEIWEAIGADNADQLILSSLYDYAQNIDLTVAAQILLIKEEQLFAGEFYDPIYAILLSRGLLPYDIDAGQNRTVCLDDTTQLGIAGPVVSLESAEISWSPSISVVDPEALNPFVVPDESGYYYLSVTDNATQLTYTDSVYVTVDYCFDTETPSEIKLLNSDRFRQGRGNLVLEIPDTYTSVQLRCYDLFGHLLLETDITGNTRHEIYGDHLSAGMYFIQLMLNDSEEQVFKVERVR